MIIRITYPTLIHGGNDFLCFLFMNYSWFEDKESFYPYKKEKMDQYAPEYSKESVIGEDPIQWEEWQSALRVGCLRF